MPDLDLTSSRLKLERAREHLTALDEAVEQFKAGGAAFTTVECRFIEDEVPFEGICCGEILRPTPIRWGLPAGDAIHNMRTALDHLVCSLVEAAGNEPTRANQFPIYSYEPDADRLAGSLLGMAEEPANEIEAMQPYLDASHPRSQMLVALRDLDNRDKHHLVTPTFAISWEAQIERDPAYESRPEQVEFLFQNAIEPGTPLLRWRVAHRVYAPTTYHLGYTVAVGPPNATRRNLEQMWDGTSAIIDCFG